MNNIKLDSHKGCEIVLEVAPNQPQKWTFEILPPKVLSYLMTDGKNNWRFSKQPLPYDQALLAAKQAINNQLDSEALKRLAEEGLIDAPL